MIVCTSDRELAELIARARRDEGDARGRLLELYRNYVTILARMQIDRRLRGKVAASDLVQETFLQAEQEFGNFRGRCEGELIVWLRRVLSTQVARLYRHYSAQRRDFQLERRLNDELDHSSQMLRHALDAGQTPPSRAAARREEAVLLADALEKLTCEYREVIVLRNLKGLSFDEVAAEMNRTVYSVKNLWARALAKLRDLLRDQR